MDIVEDENDFTIVKSTIDLAHNLGITVIAEGVENLEVYNILKDLDCDAVQGFFISYPLEPRQLEAFLDSELSPPIKTLSS